MRWQRVVTRAISEGAGALVLRPRHGLRVILYHAVGTAVPGDTYGLSIEPARFAAHVRLLAAAHTPPVVAIDHAPPSDRAALAITFDDGFADVLDVAAPLLQERALPARLFVTTGYLDQPGYLSRRALVELAAIDGMSVGSHGLTHRRMTRLDDGDLHTELRRSREELEDLLGQTVDSLSYPNGAVDRRVRDAAVDAGYSLAASSRWRVNRPGDDRMQLGRCEIVADDTTRVLMQKVHGAWDWYGIRGDAA